MAIDKKTEQWENFVNNFIFAKFKNLEIWYIKREAVINGIIFNYIKFPKAENGKNLSIPLIEFMVQSIEADESMCKKIFGPSYKIGTAEIQEDINDISIIWNKCSVMDLMNFDYNNQSERKQFEQLYKWDINVEKLEREEAERYRPKRIDELTTEEIDRRNKINKILRLIALQSNDPKMAPENKTPEDLEKCYLDYIWEKSPVWDKIDNEQFLRKFIIRKYNQEIGKYALYNPITLKWLNELAGNWVEKLQRPKKTKWN